MNHFRLLLVSVDPTCEQNMGCNGGQLLGMFPHDIQ